MTTFHNMLILYWALYGKLQSNYCMRLEENKYLNYHRKDNSKAFCEWPVVYIYCVQ